MSDKDIWVLGDGPIRPLPEGPERTEIEGVLRRAGLASTFTNEGGAMNHPYTEGERTGRSGDHRPMIPACIEDFDVALDETYKALGEVEDRLTPILTIHPQAASSENAKPSAVQPALVTALRDRTERLRKLRDRLTAIRNGLEI